MWFSDSCQDDNILNCDGAEDQSQLFQAPFPKRRYVDQMVKHDKEDTEHGME